jgi:putative hydrolase of the HAD superfamily
VTGRQSLILDADDTLWENNIYFESAFDEFVDFLRHSTLTEREVRDVLDSIEAVNARIHGYGSANFGRNLQQTYRHLCERDISERDLATVMSFAERILEQPVRLIDGVTETLDYLVSRHDLTLMTKGHPEEQKLKLDRSRLGVYFGHTAIVREKDESAYSALIASRGLRPEATWMIGNSPRSDINPALGAGINAVYIPHPRTWILEKEEIRPSGGARLIEVEKFSDLRKHF